MEFYSNGKLFILGEYYVLEGAKVFALPTKFGQYLNVFPLKTKTLSWKSYDADGSVWFNDDIAINDILSNNQSSTDKVRNTLVDILHQAHLMNPLILENNGFLVEAKLTFPRNWGLGTSSTLINNIAQWFEIDAFELLQRSFWGSGYDIACAQNNVPVTYQVTNHLPVFEQYSFNPTLNDNIYMVNLNQKRTSKEVSAYFKKRQKNLTNEVNKVSKMSDELLQIKDLDTFNTFFKRYEQNLSTI